MNKVMSSQNAAVGPDSPAFLVGEHRTARAGQAAIADQAVVNRMASRTAPTALTIIAPLESGVALRLPPHSKIANFLPVRSCHRARHGLRRQNAVATALSHNLQTLTAIASPESRSVSPADEGFPLCASVSRWPTRAFSLVEVLVVVSLLSLIVLVLMTVFNSTQKAFRAGVTQTDVLEGSRAAMDLLVSDLKLMSPSDGPTNNPNGSGFYDINFYAGLNWEVDNYLPLIQSLPGSPNGFSRTNLLENIFWLSRQNLNGHDSWVGIGYTVIATNASPLFPLYRFVTNAPASADPTAMYNEFLAAIQVNAFTNTGWSHIIDGVVDLRIQPYDVNGYAITNSFQYNSGVPANYPSTAFTLPTPYGPSSYFYFLSNAIPASVEIQMGSLEDAVLRRAESFGGPGVSENNYLSQQVGRTHVFRQRVLLPNVDPSAYP
jgi:type II secretory pathway pseudopilin PulG